MALRSQPKRKAGTASTLRIVRNEAAREADLLIYGPIDEFWGVNAQQVVREIKALDVDTIHVRINSEGGDVFDGVAIFNALREHQATVVTHIDALAASIASVIALAGDEVRMADNAMFMIHDPWIFTIGNAKDLRKTADLLDKVGDTSILRTYAAKSTEDEAQLRAWMEAETWFTAEEAADAGFIDVIDARSAAVASVDPSILAKFRHAPAALRSSTPSAAEPPATIREFEALLREKCGFSHAAARTIAASGFKPQTDPRDEGVPGVSIEPLASLAGDIRSLLPQR